MRWNREAPTPRLSPGHPTFTRSAASNQPLAQHRPNTAPLSKPRVRISSYEARDRTALTRPNVGTGELRSPCDRPLRRARPFSRGETDLNPTHANTSGCRCFKDSSASNLPAPQQCLQPGRLFHRKSKCVGAREVQPLAPMRHRIGVSWEVSSRPNLAFDRRLAPLSLQCGRPFPSIVEYP